MIELTDDERRLLDHHGGIIDTNIAVLSHANQAVKVSTEMFQSACELILRVRGHDPARWRVVRRPDGVLEFQEKEA